MSNKLILTSWGLNVNVGKRLIGKALRGTDLKDKKIFLFYEPYYSVEAILIRACLDMGFQKENIILSSQLRSVRDVRECDVFYVTEGNVFEVTAILRERGLDKEIQEAFRVGNKIYIGASAGAMIAGVSIEEGEYFDENKKRMRDYEGLGLFNGVIIPHYTKEELKRYIRNSPGIEAKYPQILSVSNQRRLVLEV